MPGWSRRSFLGTALGFVAGFATRAHADQDSPPFQVPLEPPRGSSFRLVETVTGLSRPWSLTFLPDGDMLISERSGGLVRIADGKSYVVGGLPGGDELVARGQGGMLEVLPDLDFPATNLVFFTFSHRWRGGIVTALARGRLVGDQLREVEVLLRALPRKDGPQVTGSRHYGGKLCFDGTGAIIMSVGDRGMRDQAPGLDNHLGKLLRLDRDGKAMGDNPFVATDDALPEIWSYGHRNPQGLVYDRKHDRVWITEHGPRGGDELNLVVRGAHYGWPLASWGQEYSGGAVGPNRLAGTVQPMLHWTPSIAPSGLAMTNGGDLLAGALKYRQLRRIRMDGTRPVAQEILVGGKAGRVRDVRVDGQGVIWLVEDARRGSVYKLEQR